MREIFSFFTSFGSFKPRSGSGTKNKATASRNPGNPVIKKAFRQPNCAAMTPPNANPIAAPIGIAKEKNVMALFLRSAGYASEITAGAMAPKLASPKPTMIRQNNMKANP